MTARSFYRRHGKRVLDVVFALLGLLVLWPVLLISALAVRLDSAGPVFFIQPRLGRDGRIFGILKLRTMTHRERDPVEEVFGGHVEVTAAGKWLRRLKLDELPQILNILAGDMSFVGPRPALPKQLEQYDTATRRRLEVRPGLTGLAQIHGNIHLSWEQRWQWDLDYVDRVSFLTDMGIMLLTVRTLILGEEATLRSRSDD